MRDMPALLALNAALAGRDAFTRTSLRTHVQKGSVFLAREAATPSGFVIVRRARVLAIVVGPQHRRRGMGFALLQSAIKAGGKRCEIRASNGASEALFRKAGFVVQELKPAMYADGEAGLKMMLGVSA